MKSLRVVGFGLLMLAAIGLAGCGDGQGSVTGTVALDGQPVPEGTITFTKMGGDLAREGAIIKDGSFRAKVAPGKYTIVLNAQKVVGKKKQKGFDGKDEEIEIREEMFPAKFNTKSELSEEIKPGSNTIKLDLKSK